MCGLSSNPFDIIFYRAEIFNFNKIQLQPKYFSHVPKISYSHLEQMRVGKCENKGFLFFCFFYILNRNIHGEYNFFKTQEEHYDNKVLKGIKMCYLELLPQMIIHYCMV